MANPVDQRPDGPDGVSPFGEQADPGGPGSGGGLPTRVPFAKPFPGSAYPSGPPPAQWPAERPSYAPVEVVPEPADAGRNRKSRPADAGRNRKSRLLVLVGAVLAALLAAGTLWWSQTRGNGPAPPSGAAAPTVTASPATGGGSATAGAVTGAPTRPATPGTASKVQVNTSGRNLALNGVATASSVERADLAASNAVDGDPATRWGSGFSDPQWLQVDLGGRWQVKEIRLTWENAYATGYRMQLSLDGTTWQTVYRTSAGPGGDVVVEVPGIPARFVRMYGTERSTDHGYSLVELDVR